MKRTFPCTSWSSVEFFAHSEKGLMLCIHLVFLKVGSKIYCGYLANCMYSHTCVWCPTQTAVFSKKLITNLLRLFNQRQVVFALYNVFISHFLDIKHHEAV